MYSTVQHCTPFVFVNMQVQYCSSERHPVESLTCAVHMPFFFTRKDSISIPLTLLTLMGLKSHISHFRAQHLFSTQAVLSEGESLETTYLSKRKERRALRLFDLFQGLSSSLGTQHGSLCMYSTA